MLTVYTNSGPLKGLESNGVTFFLGIPYAAPPEGQRRFKPPQPIEPWKDVREATSFGFSCPQPRHWEIGNIGEQDEDCLTLNIWTPAKSASDNLPVLFWIHGGGFVMGSSAQDAFNGERLAQLGIITVTINYRLGVFGFLAHPLLSVESGKGISGNYGIQDQITALKWIYDNIDRFGGDASNITVCGQSAGATSVLLFLCSPLTKGLFSRAIAQSGYAVNNLRYLKQVSNGMESSETMGLKFAINLGLNDSDDPLKELRYKAPRELMGAWAETLGCAPGGTPGEGFINNLTVDGYVIPDIPRNILMAGKQHPVPFMTGTTADEGSIRAASSNLSRKGDYQEFIKMQFGVLGKKYLENYPAKNDREVFGAYSRLITDGYVAGVRAAARAMASLHPDSYLYQFTHVTQWGKDQGFGAYHGSEIPFLFRNSFDSGPSDGEQQLSEIMIGYWTQFAATGNPNRANLPPWPCYTETDDRHQILAIPVSTGKNLRQKACEFLESAYPGMSLII